jgi:hypothetical protein
MSRHLYHGERAGLPHLFMARQEARSNSGTMQFLGSLFGTVSLCWVKH